MGLGFLGLVECINFFRFFFRFFFVVCFFVGGWWLGGVGGVVFWLVWLQV